MKVAVIGAGHMGSAFVGQFTRAGHQVRVTARDAAAPQGVGLRAGRVVVDITDPLTADCMVGYGAGQGTGIGPAWIRKA